MTWAQTFVGTWFIVAGLLMLLSEAKVIRSGTGQKLPWLLSFQWSVLNQALRNRDRQRDGATFWAITLSMIAMNAFIVVFGIFLLFSAWLDLAQ